MKKRIIFTDNYTEEKAMAELIALGEMLQYDSGDSNEKMDKTIKKYILNKKVTKRY